LLTGLMILVDKRGICHDNRQMELDKVNIDCYKPKRWRDASTLIRVYIIFALYVIISVLYCRGQELIITEHDFTNQEYSFSDVKKFIGKFKNNRMTDEQVWFGYWQCRSFLIHPLIWLSTMEKETSIVSVPISTTNNYKWREHRAMGYGLIKHKIVSGKKYYNFGFYEVQVHSGVKCLRKWFDDYKAPLIMSVNNGDATISVNDKVTYAITRYTPHTKANDSFLAIYSKFKNIWDGDKN